MREAISIIIIRFFRKVRLLKKLNIFYFKKINGHLFRIPVINQQGLEYNNHGVEHFEITEKWMLKIFTSVYDMFPGTFVDVGANIGQTFLKFHSVDSKRKYIAIEPNPLCIYYLENLIALNGCKNITLAPFGITNKSILKPLYFNYDNQTGSGGSYLPYEENPLVKFSAAYNYESFKELLMEKIGILKIDVEGYELTVFEELRKKIQFDLPLIIFEHLYSISKNGINGKLKTIIDLLSSLDYLIYNVEYKDKHSAEFRLQELNNIKVVQNLSEDFIALPSKNKDGFLTNHILN